MNVVRPPLRFSVIGGDRVEIPVVSFRAYCALAGLPAVDADGRPTRKCMIAALARELGLTVQHVRRILKPLYAARLVHKDGVRVLKFGPLILGDEENAVSPGIMRRPIDGEKQPWRPSVTTIEKLKALAEKQSKSLIGIGIPHGLTPEQYRLLQHYWRGSGFRPGKSTLRGIKYIHARFTSDGFVGQRAESLWNEWFWRWRYFCIDKVLSKKTKSLARFRQNPPPNMLFSESAYDAVMDSFSYGVWLDIAGLARTGEKFGLDAAGATKLAAVIGYTLDNEGEQGLAVLQRQVWSVGGGGGGFIEEVARRREELLFRWGFGERPSGIAEWVETFARGRL